MRYYEIYCKNGHKRTPQNTDKYGKCRICTSMRQASSEYKANKREYYKKRRDQSAKDKTTAVVIAEKPIVGISASTRDLLDAEQRAINREIDAKYWTKSEPPKSLKETDPEYFMELKRIYEEREYKHEVR